MVAEHSPKSPETVVSRHGTGCSSGMSTRSAPSSPNGRLPGPPAYRESTVKAVESPAIRRLPASRTAVPMQIRPVSACSRPALPCVRTVPTRSSGVLRFSGTSLLRPFAAMLSAAGPATAVAGLSARGVPASARFAPAAADSPEVIPTGAAFPVCCRASIIRRRSV